MTFNLFILSQEIDVREFQSTTVCVRGEICFKEIVSNTRPDLNHLSFTHLVCELLIICRFPFIDMYSISLLFLLSHLFVLLLIFRSIYCFLFINHIGKLYIYIYIFNYLKVGFIYFNLFFWLLCELM